MIPRYMVFFQRGKKPIPLGPDAYGPLSTMSAEKFGGKKTKKKPGLPGFLFTAIWPECTDLCCKGYSTRDWRYS